MIGQPVPLPLRGFIYKLNFSDSQSRQHEVAISSLGAALLNYRVGNKDVVVSFVDNEGYTSVYSGIVLLPYPNRLEDGIYEYNGTNYSTSVNEFDNNNNLHAQAEFHNFQILNQSDDSITLGLRMPLHYGYPFDIYTEVTYTLGEEGLSIATVAKNLSTTTAPWGLGFHPWFAVRGEYADAALEVQANSRVTVNQRMLPTGEVAVDGKYDLRTLQGLGDNQYDDAFLDFSNSESEPAVTLRGADGHETYVYADKTLPVFQICTRADQTETGLQNTVAIEPCTCYANAFKTGRLLIELAPEQVQQSRWRIDFK
jgi:aldose 1-epimerase